MRKPRHAFTLVELLATLAIIVVLLAIMVPGLAAAREQARRAGCAGNLRQLGIVASQYANDSLGQLPPSYVGGFVAGMFTMNGTDWIATQRFNNPDVHAQFPTAYASLLALSPSRKFLVCPTADPTTDGPWSSITPYSDASYRLNENVFDANVLHILKPASVVMAQEGLDRENIGYLRPGRVTENNSTEPRRWWHQSTPSIYSYWHDWKWASHGLPAHEEDSTLHADGGNLLYADGHADYRLNTNLHPIDFGLTTGPASPGPFNKPQGQPNDPNTPNTNWSVYYSTLGH